MVIQQQRQQQTMMDASLCHFMVVVRCIVSRGCHPPLCCVVVTTRHPSTCILAVERDMGVSLSLLLLLWTVTSTLPSLGYSIWNPWNFEMESIPFSGGFHGMVDGFHTISRVESIWNHNFPLILHHFQSGFHMEWIELKYNYIKCILLY
jgi:hypothetical protein